jgi:hypothetical protein
MLIPPGEYFLSVFDEHGCQNSTSIKVVPAPEIEVSLDVGDLDICIGETVEIKLIIDLDKITDIKWHYVDTLGQKAEFGFDSANVYIGKSGTYFAHYKTKYGCEKYTNDIVLNVRLDSNSFDYVFSDKTREESYADTKYPKLVCRTLTIKNITQENQELANAYFKDNIEFTVPPGQFPIEFEPWGEADINVCFTAYDLDTRYDTLIIRDKCWNTAIPMKVESIGNHYTANGECDLRIDFTTKGIDQKFVAFFDRPYPNPGNKDLYVNSIGKFENIQKSKVSIVNTAGVLQKFDYEFVNTTDESAILKISHNLISGSYILYIKSGDKQFSYNFVVGN